MFKLNISEKGKAWKFEGYEFMITGGSDSAGFPLSKEVEGIALKRVLLTKGWGMRDSRKGVRLRKTVRGKQITSTTSQINLSVVKVGSKKLTELFPEQNKPAEVKTEKAAEVAPTI